MEKMVRRLFFILAITFSLSAYAQEDTIRLFCIGNSFSWDAVEQELYPLMAAENKPIIIANLYYGGCSLEQHVHFLQSDTAVYSLRVIRDGIRTVTEGVTLRQALSLMPWDYVSFQQASHDSGVRGSYEPYLTQLMDTVSYYHPQAKLCWLMTWAYAKNAHHPAFPRYNNSQNIMRDSIVACTRLLLEDHPNLLLVPCGTAIQNARHTMGDVLCRDGYHLNYVYGRYTASCVWFEILAHQSCVGNPYMNPGMTEEQRIWTQNAAHMANLRPFLRKNAKKTR